jgi:Protein of unknown function (DUF1565)
VTPLRLLPGLVLVALLAAPLGAPAQPAPLAASLFVTGRGSDSARCTKARPCATVARAFRVARPGAVISVAPGSYPSQTILAVPGRFGASVIILGNGARFGEIFIRASRIELRHLVAVDGWDVEPGASNVSLVDVVSTSSVFITSASAVRVIGGSIDGQGRYWTNGSQVKPAAQGAPEPRDIVFDHVTIRNFRKAPGSSNHVDCLHVMSAVHVVIRNSYFANCEHFDVLFTRFLGDTPSDILVENNEFHCCGSGYYALLLGGGHGESFAHVNIRNNTADNALSAGTQNTLVDVRFSNNLVPGIAGCQRNGVRTDHNLLYATRLRCDRTDLRAAPGFVSTTDLHLAPRSRAIDRGGGNAPATDRDAHRRGSPPDIGAYERPSPRG